jgi:Na+-translocating ferredoxin:NAD+ oxidoreductase RnfD subunit
MKIDRKYGPPLLITLILIGAHWSAGVLRGYEAIALAIGCALAADLVVGRWLMRERRPLSSAYISGISIGILVRSPMLWPYAIGSLLSILSKYVLRLRGRHLWNPSNFGIVAMLVLASHVVASLSVQWGNMLLPMVVVWVFGCVIIHRLGRFHITLTYVLSFVAFSLLRAAVTGHPWPAEVAPITGPMYQLYIFFMITDPKTTVRGKRAQCLVVFLVAAVEAGLRLLEFVHAPYYALFAVGPVANLVEILRDRRARAAGTEAA